MQFVNIKNELLKPEMVEATELKNSIEKIKFRRYGWMLDAAGGLVLGFRNDDFQNSILQQYAFWLNGGYSLKKGFSFWGVARYNTSLGVSLDENGNKKDESTFDFGGKIELETSNNKFAMNLEFVERMASDSSVSRYAFNASYQVGKNQALTFSFGKSFNNTQQYRGNLIAILKYAKTFGTKRTLVPKN